MPKSNFKPNAKAIRITATTVSPLLQTSEAGGQRKRFVYENGERGKIPFFSANGLKGGIRRWATRQQLSACTCDKKKVTPELFYLYASGAGLSRIDVDNMVTPENEAGIREKSPILSVFGAGLSGIEGKIAVADFCPAPDQERWATAKDGTRYSAIMGSGTFFRTDAIRDSEMWRDVLNVEAIEAWRDEYAQKVIAGKKAKAKEEKETNSHIQQPVNMEFILPGVKLTSSIKAKYGNELSDVEMGMIISSLLELSQTQIGSGARIGWGVLDWTVEYDGRILFQTKSNPGYTLDRSVSISPAGEELIGKWNEWLESNADNILGMQVMAEKLEEARLKAEEESRRIEEEDDDA